MHSISAIHDSHSKIEINNMHTRIMHEDMVRF